MTVENMKMGICEDIACEYAEQTDPFFRDRYNPALTEASPEPTPLTYLKYINTNKGPAWVCEGCLEAWSDALEEYTDNMADLDLPDAYPVIF